MSQSGVVTTHDPAEAEMARTIYILYLVGWVIPIITPIIGLILAYMNRDGAPAWVQSHYEMQIRTFWIGALFTVISFLITILIFSLLGWLIFLLAIIWWIVRCVKGLQALFNGTPYENPTSWLW